MPRSSQISLVIPIYNAEVFLEESLAAVEAGAGQIECTVNGIGERAGNTSLKEVTMILRSHKEIDVDTNINATHMDGKLHFDLRGPPAGGRNPVQVEFP